MRDKGTLIEQLKMGLSNLVHSAIRRCLRYLMPHSGVGFHWVTVAHPDYGQIACILDEGELLLPINTIYRLFSINNTQSDEILSFITKNLEYHALFYTADRYSCVFCIYLADLDLVLDGVA